LPLYRCAVAAGRSREEQRARIAKEIVRIHCGVTGAPPSFVHAFFSEARAGELPEGRLAFVLGSIRSGRSGEQKRRIAREIGEAVASALGCAADEVGVALAEVPSKWIMEGGVLLPEPGEEAEWLARHRQPTRMEGSGS
jgi:phenylpyruvate tautomerase PptA (4-oxalocrotonate tautomerase family)